VIGGRVAAIALLLVSCIAAGALLAVEGAADDDEFGRPAFVEPCTAPPDPFPERGLDAVLQRIALSGLNGAACELGTDRESLVLSLAPGSGFDDVDWDRPTLERALRSGFRRAIDDAVERGSLPRWGAAILRTIVDRAPIGFLLDQVDVPFF
jgi:hypothetical protein